MNIADFILGTINQINNIQPNHCSSRRALLSAFLILTKITVPIIYKVGERRCYPLGLAHQHCIRKAKPLFQSSNLLICPRIQYQSTTKKRMKKADPEESTFSESKIQLFNSWSLEPANP